MGPGEGPEEQAGLLITGETVRMLDGEDLCVQTLPREHGMLRFERMRRGHWGGVATEDMYGIAERWANRNDDPAAAYVTIFKFAAAILHVRKHDMLMKMTDDGTIYPNLRADPTCLTFVLFMSNLLYISILRAGNEVFRQLWTLSIQGLLDELPRGCELASPPERQHPHDRVARVS